VDEDRPGEVAGGPARCQRSRRHQRNARSSLQGARPYLRIAGLYLLAALLSLGFPIGIGLRAQHLEPHEWHWDDWAAVATSVWLSLLFFGLAFFVNRRAASRAEAMANAELITSTGSLAMSSARSFAGHDQQALRIAADARAALQHYPHAAAAEQHALIRTIEDSYSDLAFGTFARADGLPRSVWDGLCAGAQTLAAEAAALAGPMRKKGRSQQLELKGLAAHVRFVQRIGDAVRVPAAARDARLAAGFRPLDTIWWDKNESSAEEVELNSTERLERLRCLYNRELTVLKKWEVLLEQPDLLDCSAILVEDLRLTDGWLAPWYVLPVQDGTSCLSTEAATLRQVNVLQENLTESRAADQLFDRGTFPCYPDALRHGHLPEGLRAAAIQNLCELLVRQSPVTVCVLTYEATRPDGSIARMVLDGNHRLAAARRLFLDWHGPATGITPSPVRVLAFTISEQQPVDTRVAQADVLKSQEKFLPWRGFTPDVTLLHGHDYPEKSDPTPGTP